MRDLWTGHEIDPQNREVAGHPERGGEGLQTEGPGRRTGAVLKGRSLVGLTGRLLVDFHVGIPNHRGAGNCRVRCPGRFGMLFGRHIFTSDGKRLGRRFRRSTNLRRRKPGFSLFRHPRFVNLRTRCLTQDKIELRFGDAGFSFALVGHTQPVGIGLLLGESRDRLLKV